MPWLKTALSHTDRDRIEAALKAADLQTCGEIIPVVARNSAPYGHTPWLAAALLLALAESAHLGRRLGGLAGFASPWFTAPALALLCAAAGWLVGRFAAVRWALTPHRDRAQAVHQAAEAAFHRLALHRARGDAGVLLYVSLEERRAVVLAGAGIADLAGAGHWKDTCRTLTSAAAAKKLGFGFETAIAQCAKIMAQHHPADGHEKNVSLSQRLKILHNHW